MSFSERDVGQKKSCIRAHVGLTICRAETGSRSYRKFRLRKRHTENHCEFYLLRSRSTVHLSNPLSRDEKSVAGPLKKPPRTSSLPPAKALPSWRPSKSFIVVRCAPHKWRYDTNDSDEEPKFVDGEDEQRLPLPLQCFSRRTKMRFRAQSGGGGEGRY